MDLEFKKEFIEKYTKLTNFIEYEAAINRSARKSIRVNILKVSIGKIKKSLLQQWNLERIPWIKEGFWIDGFRTDIGNTYEHQLGYIYVQEAASMLPPIILSPKKTDVVLDATASPGSKTTQIAAMMKNEGLIIANDVSYYRMLPLAHNLQRCGVSNTITTVMDAKKINMEFDKILLDAPCTGIGIIMGNTQNSRHILKTYSLHLIKTMAGIQKRLILNLYHNLKSKGTLVYSTCSLEPEEDEEVIQFLLDETDAKLEKISVNIKSEINLDYGNYSSELKKCIKLWPQVYHTEGFFIAKIKKP